MSIAAYLDKNSVPVFGPRTGSEMCLILENLNEISATALADGSEGLPVPVELYRQALHLVVTVASCQQGVMLDRLDSYVKACEMEAKTESSNPTRKPPKK